MNLLAKIEAEINSVANEIQRNRAASMTYEQWEQFNSLFIKKEKLSSLAMQCIDLQNQLKQLTALTSA